MARNGMKGMKETVKDEEVESTDETSFATKLVGLRDKYKLGPHHKIERFGVFFGISVLGLVLTSGAALAVYRSDMANMASETAIMSEDFEYSLSGQGGGVLGVFGDVKRTDVTVLFKMDDPKSMSADADTYQLFITGLSDSIDPATAPDVSFGLFGATGYGYIRFEQASGLPNEVLDVTIRSSAELSIADGQVSSDVTDGSFSEYDQARLLVNPGATRVTKATYPVGEEDPVKLYTGLVGNTLDAEIREEIEKSTLSMKTSLNRADEYASRLAKAGYEVPKTPWFLKGDYVDKDDDLRASSYLALAHKVNYKDYSLEDGYIKQVAGDLRGFDKYVEDYNEKRSTDHLREGKKSETVVLPEVLVREDGTKLKLSNVIPGSSSSAQVSAKEALTDLSDTWRAYLDEKRKIQVDYSYKLLVLDADVLSQKESYSKNDKKDLAVFY